MFPLREHGRWIVGESSSLITHTTNATKQARKKQHIKYMENPSKSPDLSPVEQSMEAVEAKPKTFRHFEAGPNLFWDVFKPVYHLKETFYHCAWQQRLLQNYIVICLGIKHSFHSVTCKSIQKQLCHARSNERGENMTSHLRDLQ